MAWKSRLQKCVKLFTTNAEFIVISKTSKKLLWFKKLLHKLDFFQYKYVLFVDSQSVIHLDKNLTFYSRFKHVDVRCHWICDVFNVMLLELAKVYTDYNSYDVMIKSLPRGKVWNLWSSIWQSSPRSCDMEICWVFDSLPKWRKT